MTCSVSRVQSCASLYSELWLVLILGFKVRNLFIDSCTVSRLFPASQPKLFSSICSFAAFPSYMPVADFGYSCSS